MSQPITQAPLSEERKALRLTSQRIKSEVALNWLIIAATMFVDDDEEVFSDFVEMTKDKGVVDAVEAFG